MIDSEQDQLDQRVQYIEWRRCVKKDLPNFTSPEPCGICMSRMLRAAAKRLFLAGGELLKDLSSTELNVVGVKKTTFGSEPRDEKPEAAAAANGGASSSKTNAASKKSKVKQEPNQAGMQTLEIFLEDPDAPAATGNKKGQKQQLVQKQTAVKNKSGKL